MTATEYAHFAPCHASAVDQEAVELDIDPVLRATCGTYGDFWGDATCGTTRNFLSSLHAQRLLAQLIEGHERSSQEYDLILVARLDVLFTDAIPTDLIQRLAVAVETRRETIVTPDWGVYSHINDRFAFGTRTSMPEPTSRYARAPNSSPSFVSTRNSGWLSIASSPRCRG